MKKNIQKDQWPAIEDLVRNVLEQKTTALELVEESIRRITEVDKDYNSIIAVIPERARERAKEIDIQIKNGTKTGKLAGIPFIAKDNFLVFGEETTAASNMLKGFTAPYQSTAIEKLEAEGAICVAKANLDAFAHGASTENSDFFVTKNPHDISRVAGGSSGGSAASVALHLAPFALGTDTGGSIREPASFCGVVGLKPTYGLVSRSGVVAMASSTDVIGPIATRVEDAALVLECISGVDPLDSTTIEKDPSGYRDIKSQTYKGKKIGVITEYMGDGLEDDVRIVMENSIKKLREDGADIIDISIPSLPLALAVYYIVVPAELSSNLSRHDGQRFNFSVHDTSDLEESYVQSRTRGFGAEAKRRIMIGTHVLSSGYYDAYYKKAQTVRTKLCKEFSDAFNKVDFLIGPVAPEVAFKIGANADDPLKMYLIDIMTVAVNLVGIPAISVPAGVGKDSMPVGLQIMANQKQDKDLLEIAMRFEELRK